MDRRVRNPRRHQSLNIEVQDVTLSALGSKCGRSWAQTGRNWPPYVPAKCRCGKNTVENSFLRCVQISPARSRRLPRHPRRLTSIGSHPGTPQISDARDERVPKNGRKKCAVFQSRLERQNRENALLGTGGIGDFVCDSCVQSFRIPSVLTAAFHHTDSSMHSLLRAIGKPGKLSPPHTTHTWSTYDGNRDSKHCRNESASIPSMQNRDSLMLLQSQFPVRVKTVGS